MKKYMAAAVLGILSLPCFGAQAEEMKVPAETRKDLFLNIYQQNLALVKNDYKLKLADGVSVVAFEGVSEQMQPQTTLIDGSGITVLEKNYEYNLLNRENLLEAYVGKEVSAVTIDHETSKNVFDKALLMNNDYGNPMLKFSYGIDPHFPGRIVFPDVPANLRLKPTLVAKVASKGGEAKNVSLSYLSGGLSWTGNYVAEIVDSRKMDLQSWVEISNQSGTDFKNAKVTLVSGDVNNGGGSVQPRPLMMAAMRKMNYDAEVAADSGSGEIAAQSFGEYYSYNLPGKADVLNKQSKQISLWSAAGAGYEKQYKLVSPLADYARMFERRHAAVVYKITNSKAQKLGQPMPSGTIRFYEKDGNGNLSFTGAAEMPQLAVDESVELNIGKSYDVYANGKIVNFSQIAENTTETDYEVSFFNAGKKEVKVIWEQKTSGEAKVLKESAKSKRTDAGLLRWQISVPAGGESKLTYQLRQTRN